MAYLSGPAASIAMGMKIGKVMSEMPPIVECTPEEADTCRSLARDAASRGSKKGLETRRRNASRLDKLERFLARVTDTRGVDVPAPAPAPAPTPVLAPSSLVGSVWVSKRDTRPNSKERIMEVVEQVGDVLTCAGMGGVRNTTHIEIGNLTKSRRYVCIRSAEASVFTWPKEW